tara:strand:- start:111 stop:689 length:579 start_codon:yes stop_codon:yes gene_type:complete
MVLIDRIRLVLPFWILSAFYFLIPFIRGPIDAPYIFINIDKQIPFVWWMIVPYYLYYFGLLLPLIINNKMFLSKFVQTCLILLSISYSVFIIWPISCEQVMMSVTNNPLSFLYGAVEIEWLKQNGLPSVHVTISMFTALVMAQYKPQYKLFFLICGFLVFLSTFLAKQHFVIDSLAGLFLSGLGYIRWKRSL